MNRRKTVFVFIALSGMTLFADAHEFWMEAGRFYFKTAESAVIRFNSGEDFSGEGWRVAIDSVTRLEHHSAKQVKDLKTGMKDISRQGMSIPLVAEGSHVITLETTASFARMNGQQFTEYLEKEGLDEVLYQRRKDGVSGEVVTELASIHSKLILQAGEKKDDAYGKVCNLPIEIIPEKNPALLKKGDPIAFRILFKGKPLFGAKVKVWNRYNHRTSLQNIYSQQDGRIETHVSNPGAWMVSVVKMVRSDEARAQYRSYRGTLVFGVR